MCPHSEKKKQQERVDEQKREEAEARKAAEKKAEEEAAKAAAEEKKKKRPAMDQAYLNNLKGFFKKVSTLEFFFSNEGQNSSKSRRPGAISWLRYDKNFFFQQIWLLFDPEHVFQVKRLLAL